VRLLQLNMCGWVCRASDGAKEAGVADELADFRADAVSLNEVCRDQVPGIVADADERGWPMHARFLVADPGGCGNGVDFGNALLTRAAILDTDVLTFTAQGTNTPERRGLLCADVDLAGRRTRVCSTHLVAGDEDPTGSIKRAQVVAVADRVRAAGTPVVLMGDYNLPPGDRGLAALYSPSHPGGHGAFDEVDQGVRRCRCGEPTHGRGKKLDYIFVTAADFSVVGGNTVAAGFSDHHALRGRVRAR
jgi:endonuclease/exonuclease/phosphatase family metal-dependent hydrolase